MTNMNDSVSFHRNIIKKALDISWKHKHLWLVGFFAAFSGFGGALEPLVKIYDRTVDTMPIGSGDMLGFRFLPGIATVRTLVSFSNSPRMTLFLCLLAGLAISAIFAWIVVMALGATVSGVKSIVRGKDMDFPESLKEAGKEFWRLLGVVVGIKLASLAAALMIGINLISYDRSENLLSGMFFFLSFALLGAVAVIISIVGVYSVMAIIDEKIMIREAFRRGCMTFADNWLVSLEAAVIILLVQLCFVLLSIGAVMVISVPLILLMMVAIYLNLGWMVVLISILAAVAVVLLMCLLAAFLTTFQITVWWQLWSKFGEKGGLLAGLERWFSRMKTRFIK